MREFEGEARPADCSNLTYRILKQADFSTLSGLSYREYWTIFKEHPVSLDERGLSLIIEQKDSR